jgi:hypothetical protein
MTTLLTADPLLVWPSGPTDTGAFEAPGNPSSEWLPGVSGFVADTWVFFADPQVDWTEDCWGLGFGPTDASLPQWSLFHCVTEDRFDARTICPHLNPSNQDLHRWGSSTVGSATATLLIQSVGSCITFYRQYFAERPDLRYRLGR